MEKKREEDRDREGEREREREIWAEMTQSSQDRARDEMLPAWAMNHLCAGLCLLCIIEMDYPRSLWGPWQTGGGDCVW